VDTGGADTVGEIPAFIGSDDFPVRPINTLL
jgi:hypothetical protein